LNERSFTRFPPLFLLPSVHEKSILGRPLQRRVAFLEPLLPVPKATRGPKIHSSPEILNHLRGDELPDGQAFGSLMRLFRQSNFVVSQ
jgi:hypothetical protein